MRINRKYTLGLIGCGHMGMAIARGAVHKEYLERFQIAVYDPDPRIQDECRLHRFIVLDSEKEVAEKSHITLLAVTPQQCEEVLEKLKDADINCLLSIVTGVSISHLQEKLNNVPVIRSMPNTPLQINAGATALWMSDNYKADDYDFVFQLFNSMGTTRTIPEEMMNNVVAVHGSIPAYVYYFIECILNDAVDRGMDEIDARALLVQTFIGAAELLAENSKTPIDEFIDEVCSKGGTTIEAVTELRNQDLEKIIHDANEKCIKRAKEIGR
jgi:pyrroline-5-carboxylate reductase